MAATFTHVEVYEIEHCCTCGIPFAMTRDFQRERREDHKNFYCPSGHPQHYTAKSDTERERERADRLSRALEQRDQIIARADNALKAEKRSNAALKGQLTKTKKRIASGVCPCCNRSFSNLGRHMAGQHPDYTVAVQG